MSFGSELASFERKALERANLARRKISLEMFQRVIFRSPVLSGRFRGNWQCSVGDYPRGTIERMDAGAQANSAGLGSRSSALDAAARVVLAAPDGLPLYLVNNLPYSLRLEYDSWSKKAPAGMVRVTLREFRGVVRDVARDATREVS